MNTIDTLQIVDPNAQQPFTGPSLKFLQDAFKDAINGVAGGIVGNSYSLGVIYVLAGCQRTGAADGDVSGAVSVTQGYIIYNKEVYFVPAFSTTNIAGNTLYSALASTSVAPDPVLFSDLSSKNVHLQRQWNISQANSGSNPQSGWVYLYDSWHYVGTTGEPAFQNSFVNINSGTARLRYRTEKLSNLMVSGYITNSGGNFTAETTIFTLPAGYRPNTERIVTASGTDDAGAYFACFLRFATNGDVSIKPYGSSKSFFLTGILIPLD